MQQIFTPVQTDVPNITFPADEIKIDQPLQADAIIKGPLMQRIMPLVMFFVVVMMLVMMVGVGSRQISPYMLMMPLSMLMGILGYSAHGGSGGTGEVNHNRTQWVLKINELRKIVHMTAAPIHATYVQNLPNPLAISSLIGVNPAKVRDVNNAEVIHERVSRMWSAFKPSENSGSTTDPRVHSLSKILVNPYMVARVGTGLTPLYPTVSADTPDISENLEPFTNKMFTTFLRTQRVIPSTPAGIDLLNIKSLGIRGPEKQVLGLTRSVIAGLAYNHSPQSLNIGIISDQHEEWDTLKWLPHTIDIKATSESKTKEKQHYAWSSFSEYCFFQEKEIRERKEKTGVFVPQIIIVDLPTSAVEFPPEIADGVPGVTFICVRAAKEDIATPRTRWLIDEKGEYLSLFHQKNFAKIDTITYAELDIIARKMAKFVPPRFGEVKSEIDPFQGVEIPNFLEALDVGNDLESYDPRVTWNKNYSSISFNSPAGYQYNWASKQVLPSLSMLNLIETAYDGSGPHGFVQGATGTGKSYMLKSLILSLCTLYGPDKYVQILADFKGGSTFFGFEKLPHTLAVISNLKSSEEMVMRLQTVLEGERDRRQAIFSKYKTKDIVAYREYRDAYPEKNLPPMPDLFIWVDEFYIFMQDHKSYLDTLIEIGAVGRSLGMHLILCSQEIEQGLVGGMKKHAKFGISLKVRSTQSSTFVVGTPDAVNLPEKNGVAIINKVNSTTGQEDISYMKSFNVEAQYVRVPGIHIKPKELSKEEAPIVHEYKLFKDRLIEDVEDIFSTISSTEELKEEYSSVNVEYSKGIDSLKVSVVDRRPMDQELIKALSKCNDDYHVRQLWATPIREPYTFFDMELQPQSSEQIILRAGDIDDPYNAARYPLTVNFSDSSSYHLRILGANGAGKTTALMSLAMSSVLTYLPSLVSWMYIDFKGSNLSLFDKLPNTLSYASRDDDEAISRSIGEIRKLIDLRQKLRSQNSLTSFNRYLEWKSDDSTIMSQDPYGHIFVALDGFDYVTSDQERREKWNNLLPDLISSSLGLGIHFIITDKSENMSSMKINNSIPKVLHLRLDERLTTLPPTIDRTVYTVKVGTIPEGQPGRGIELDTMREFIIAAPINEHIYPPIDPETGQYKEDEGMSVFNYKDDLSDRIEQFVADICEDYPDDFAPRVDKAAKVIPLDDIWETIPPVDTSASLVNFPLYLGTTLDTVSPFIVGSTGKHHIQFAGSQKSGKTNALRVIIDNITRNLTKDQAKIFIFDTKMGLLDEHEELVRTGYSREEFYVSKKENADEIVSVLVKRAESMRPTTKLSRKVISEREYYTGPEIFILIDNLEEFVTASSTKSLWSELTSIVDDFPNTGMHFCITSSTSYHDPAAISRNPVIQLLNETGSPIVGLSAPHGIGPIVDSKRTERFKIQSPGRGTVVERETMHSYGVQLYLSPRTYDES